MYLNDLPLKQRRDDSDYGDHTRLNPMDPGVGSSGPPGVPFGMLPGPAFMPMMPPPYVPNFPLPDVPESLRSLSQEDQLKWQLEVWLMHSSVNSSSHVVLDT